MTDIVDLVRQYVDLTPVGRNYKGLCPFHEERTPSFCVSPDLGKFKCFGCGVAGNGVDFVIAIVKNLSPTWSQKKRLRVADMLTKHALK